MLINGDGRYISTVQELPRYRPIISETHKGNVAIGNSLILGRNALLFMVVIELE